jgi:archaellum component FlaC
MDNLTKRLNELESKRGTFIGSNEYIEGFKEAMKLSEDFIKQLKKLWREVLNDLNSVPEVNKSSVPEKEATKNSKEKKSNISLCKNCFCMTKTIKGKCGKCKAEKENLK